MKKRTKKIAAMCASLALVAALGVGATMAYFSDFKQAENTVELGNVSIELKETTATGADWTDISTAVPGQDISKIVTVSNTGANDCYIRLRVEITNPAGAESKIGLDNLLSTNTDIDITYDNDDDKTKGYMYFKTAFSAKTATTTDSKEAFKGFKIPEKWKNAVKDGDIKVNVIAQAIQKDFISVTSDSNGTTYATDYKQAWANVTGKIDSIVPTTTTPQ